MRSLLRALNVTLWDRRPKMTPSYADNIWSTYSKVVLPDLPKYWILKHSLSTSTSSDILTITEQKQTWSWGILKLEASDIWSCNENPFSRIYFRKLFSLCLSKFFSVHFIFFVLSSLSCKESSKWCITYATWLLLKYFLM